MERARSNSPQVLWTACSACFSDLLASECKAGATEEPASPATALAVRTADAHEASARQKPKPRHRMLKGCVSRRIAKFHELRYSCAQQAATPVLSDQRTM